MFIFLCFFLNLRNETIFHTLFRHEFGNRVLSVYTAVNRKRAHIADAVSAWCIEQDHTEDDELDYRSVQDLFVKDYFLDHLEHIVFSRLPHYTHMRYGHSF